MDTASQPHAPRPVVLITGASAGIGLELARVFARHGHALALVARRTERLEKLADELAAGGSERPLVITADLAEPDAPAQIAAALAQATAEPAYVVNNAGFGLVGRAAALDRDEQLAMIDVNVRSLTALSLAFVDSLARHRGGLLNVASVAGFLPGPGSAVYYASKAYVLSFSEALSRELAPRGIRVTTLCPGPVATEFAERAGVPGKPPGGLSITAAQVAEQAYEGLMAGRRRVMPGLANRILTFAMRFLPRDTLLAAVDRRQSGRSRAGNSQEPRT